METTNAINLINDIMITFSTILTVNLAKVLGIVAVLIALFFVLRFFGRDVMSSWYSEDPDRELWLKDYDAWTKKHS